MDYNNNLSEIIVYDYKSVRRLRGFLRQILILLDERRENPTKPEHYMDAVWDYNEIQQIVDILNVSHNKNLELDSRTNSRVLEIYDAAKGHYYSRIINLFRYYQDTDKMVMTCNGKGGSVRTNFLIVNGGPKKKVA